MAFNLRTTKSIVSDKTEDQLLAQLTAHERDIAKAYASIRAAAMRCTTAKRASRYVSVMQDESIVKPDVYLDGIINSIKSEKPNWSLHDLHVGLEGVVEDYSKKVNTFAQTLITTVRSYSVTVFDLFVKKLRINKSIDTSKFTELDSSVRMVVMTYGDYVELANPIANHIGVVAKDVQSILPLLTKIRSQLSKKEDVKNTLSAINDTVRKGELFKFLKEHKLATFEYGADTNGTEGLINIKASPRLEKIEESNVLNEVGWNDIDKIKGAIIIKNAETISKQINNLYKLAVDIMDEGRRISNEYCVDDPYTCTALVKFGSIIGQEVNLYTKVFDLCWTTILRVSQACRTE